MAHCTLRTGGSWFQGRSALGCQGPAPTWGPSRHHPIHFSSSYESNGETVADSGLGELGRGCDVCVWDVLGGGGGSVCPQFPVLYLQPLLPQRGHSRRPGPVSTWTRPGVLGCLPRRECPLLPAAVAPPLPLPVCLVHACVFSLARFSPHCCLSSVRSGLVCFAHYSSVNRRSALHLSCSKNSKWKEGRGEGGREGRVNEGN